MMSRNAAERLFLQHSRERDAAHAEAKRVANRIVAGLHEVRTANTFAGLDLAELLHDLQSLNELQLKYLAEDRAVRESAHEALG
ncbi:MAG TPA: hypothetical protein PK458_20405 [Phycisphaerae bacterium]|nr:hypothetical protein [Phycisphaerae bacterium]